MAKVIKELLGHSGSKVYIMKNDDYVYVRKTGDTHRNLERLYVLQKLGLQVPKIYCIEDDSYEMEYIQNIDVKTYLSNNGISELSKFIESVFSILKKTFILKDYTETYHRKLQSVDFKQYGLSFSCDELIARLPKLLPQTQYHGDLTLENILFNVQTRQFMLIDPITTEYDSYIFDMAKLRQDLICEWFIRNDNLNLGIKLDALSSVLTKYEYYDNNDLLILMLLRVLPYSKKESDINFLIKRIQSLWK